MTEHKYFSAIVLSDRGSSSTGRLLYIGIAVGGVAVPSRCVRIFKYNFSTNFITEPVNEKVLKPVRI